MMTERTDTMKTYLLRKPQTVEPQNARRAPRTRPPATATTAREVPDRPAQPKPGPSLFIGLDVHTDSIAVSLAPADSSDVPRYGLAECGGQSPFCTHPRVARWAAPQTLAPARPVCAALSGLQKTHAPARAPAPPTAQSAPMNLFSYSRSRHAKEITPRARADFVGRGKLTVRARTFTLGQTLPRRSRGPPAGAGRGPLGEVAARGNTSRRS